jgi:hypothetical protein
MEGVKSASQALKQASGEMRDAEGKLDQGEKEPALDKEKAALEELEKAAKRLKEEERKWRKLLRLPDPRELEKLQAKTREATEKLAAEMNKPGGPDGQPAPGAGGVGKAVPSQRGAEGRLREGKPRSASRDQEKALEELQRAREQLREALRQLREQMRDELLATLEARFAEMLQRQRQISRRTVDIAKRRAAGATGDRAERVLLRELSAGELALSGEAASAADLLREEGSTAILPDIIDGLRDDLKNVSGRLDRGLVATVTQTIQKEIEATLEDLIEAVRQESENSDGQGEGGEMPGDAPLLPASAELKMLLRMQLRINDRTTAIDKQRGKGEADASLTEQARHVSRRQDDLGELTRRMGERLNKED